MTYIWEIPPAPIRKDAVVSTIAADVVVIGAGMSGLIAAVRSAELGLKVAVLEKGGSITVRGNHIGAANSRALAAYGITNDLSEIAREWVTRSGNRVKEELVWRYLKKSECALNWFIDKAAAYGIGVNIYGARYVGPGSSEFYSSHMFEGRAPALGRMLSAEAAKYHVDFYWYNPAHQLIKKSGRVTGVMAQTENGYIHFRARKGVVLATGDIGGDREMCEIYAPEALQTDGIGYTPEGANTGDGHKMGLWAGGVMQKPPYAILNHPVRFGHVQGFFLHVNASGKRFMNEDTWVQGRSNAAMKQPGGYAFSIFDAKWPQELEASLPVGGGLFWDSNNRLMGKDSNASKEYSLLIEKHLSEKKVVWRANSIKELAKQMGVPAVALADTVIRYNYLVSQGKDGDFGKRAELLTSITEPPFYAVKFGGKALVVVGGLMIDTSMRVLDSKDEPIPGLYAVGNVSGGMYALDYPLIISGSSHGRAITWGYLAGESLANIDDD